MVDGMWVVLGTAVGAVGSIFTTWLNARQQKQPDAYDDAAMALLKNMLSKGPAWRKLRTLSNVIGATEQHTKEYLLIIGARGSERDPELWGLVSRNPLPDKIADIDEPKVD